MVANLYHEQKPLYIQDYLMHFQVFEGNLFCTFATKPQECAHMHIPNQQFLMRN